MNRLTASIALFAALLTLACGSDDSPLDQAHPLSNPTPAQREQIKGIAYSLAMGQAMVPFASATQTQSCPNGGSVKISYDESAAGFFTATFNDCDSGDSVIDGALKMGQSADGSVITMEYDSLSIAYDSGELFGFDGLVRAYVDTPRVELVDLKIFIDGGYVVVNADISVNEDGTISGYIEVSADGVILGTCGFDHFDGTQGTLEGSCDF